MEAAAGEDVTARVTYGAEKSNSVQISVTPTLEGVSVAMSDTFTTFTGSTDAQVLRQKTAYNLFVKLVMKPRTYIKKRGGRVIGTCGGTPDGLPPKGKSYVTTGNPSQPVVGKLMPASQKAATDCNAARWEGKRAPIMPDKSVGNSRGQTNTFENGLKTPFGGFSVTSAFGTNTNVLYTTGNKYTAYWGCGEGGLRGENGEVDINTIPNLFVYPQEGKKVK